MQQELITPPPILPAVCVNEVDKCLKTKSHHTKGLFWEFVMVAVFLGLAGTLAIELSVMNSEAMRLASHFSHMLPVYFLS